MQSTLLRRAKENHRQRQVAGASHAAVLTVNATAMHAKARASNRLAMASRVANHGPLVRTKEKVKKTMENPKESRKVSRERSTQARANALLKTYWDSNNRNQQQTQFLTNLNRRISQLPRTQTTPGLMTFGGTLNGMTDGVQLDGIESWDRAYDNSASSLSWCRVVPNGLRGWGLEGSIEQPAVKAKHS